MRIWFANTLTLRIWGCHHRCLLLEQGKGEAEVTGLQRLDLTRYKDLDWVANVRRWPPVMVAALEKFLKLQ